MSNVLEFAQDPGGIFGAKSSREATEAQLKLGAQNLAETRREFDIGQERLEPFSVEAVPAFQLQAALSGSQGPEAQAAAIRGLQEGPGSQFAEEQGRRTIESGAGAIGGLGGGDRLRELTKFSQALAQRDFATQFNRLGIVSGAGQTAATNQAARGADFAGRTSEILNRQGEAIQAGAQAQQQAKTNLIGTAVGIAGAIASDEAKKTDVKAMSSEECFNHVINTPISVWKYLKELGIDNRMHIGPMYQESPDCIKVDGEKALDLHDELWLIAGAIKHIAEVNHGSSS